MDYPALVCGSFWLRCGWGIGCGNGNDREFKAFPDAVKYFTGDVNGRVCSTPCESMANWVVSIRKPFRIKVWKSMHLTRYCAKRNTRKNLLGILRTFSSVRFLNHNELANWGEKWTSQQVWITALVIPRSWCSLIKLIGMVHYAQHFSSWFYSGSFQSLVAIYRLQGAGCFGVPNR